MNFLNDFYTLDDSHCVQVNDEQGSRFAKTVASDFNPIHDIGAKRFCVPGDLLFAIALQRYGLYQRMRFDFLDLVKSASSLHFPEQLVSPETIVTYYEGKDVLGIQAAGELSRDVELIERVLRQYVSFSGQNFPHILRPLMQQHDVMINPARPLVIYQSMSFDLSGTAFADVNVSELQIKLDKTELVVDGKRGDAILNFSFFNGDIEIGWGAKNLVLSGLRKYDEMAMQTMCDDYLAHANLNRQPLI